ncbi:MAG: hypothetical protein ACOCVM_04795 [Desulfovibrionaceae bacterium]
MNVNGAGPVKVDQMVQKAKQETESNADYMKNIRKKKMEREMFADPSVAQKLVKAEATSGYNAKGEIVQSVDLT